MTYFVERTLFDDGISTSARHSARQNSTVRFGLRKSGENSNFAIYQRSYFVGKNQTNTLETKVIKDLQVMFCRSVERCFCMNWIL